MNDSDTVLDLVDGFLDGTISTDQLSELERRLCEESASRQLFWLAVNQEVLLRRHLSGVADSRAIDNYSAVSNPFWHKASVRWAIAAMLMAMVGFGSIIGVHRHALASAIATIMVAQIADSGSGIAGTLIHSNMTSEPLAEGQIVAAGDRIAVASGAEVELRFSGEETTAGLAGNSSLSLMTSQNGYRLLLDHGLLTAAVAHQLPGRHLLITTSQVTVEVVGTRFTVDATADSTKVDVDEGRVKVASLATPNQITEIGPGGRAVATTGQPVHAETAPGLVWADHRPLGVLMLCKAAAGWSHNPRGWLNDDTLDITTNDGLKVLHDRIESSVDQCITNMRSINAQGLIFWDMEGLESSIGYVGDPRQLSTFAPEMDSIADRLIQRVRAAGFSVGVAIRLDEVEYGHSGTATRLHSAKNPALLAQDRIAYASKRWGATLFPLLGTGTEQMDTASVCRRVHAAFPTVLLIPTAAVGDAGRWSAPWIQPDQFEAHVASLQLAGSMSVIAPLEEDFMMRHHNELIRSVAHGDVLTVRAWYLTPGHRMVHDINDAAKSAIVP